MSLTSQLDDKNSPVRQFFTKYENQGGTTDCLASLQSTKPIQIPSFKPTSFVVYGFMGTTTDYLIRYAANENILVFEKTIAYLASTFDKIQVNGNDITNHIQNLYELVT